MPKVTLTGNEVVLRAALLLVLDELTVVQGILSAPSPRPISARDIVDGAIINVAEALEV